MSLPASNAPEVQQGIRAASGRRFYDASTASWVVKVFPGEFYVAHRSDETLVTVLGSCVSACIRDAATGVGGMNHFMLPHNATGTWGSDQKSARFGNFAMEKLINELFKLGCDRERMEIKVFGGGRVLSGMTDVGERNIAFVRNYLQLEGYRIVAEDLGGTQPRKVVYFPATGRVKMRRLRPVENRIIGHHEQLYLTSIGKTAAGGGDVELFD